MTVWVQLVGGHFDGEMVEVDPVCELITLEWREKQVWRTYNDVDVPVWQIGLSSYRRVDDKTFLHCRTPTKFGDDDLAFPEAQLTIEEAQRERRDE